MAVNNLKLCCGKIAIWTNDQKIRANVMGGVWEQAEDYVMSQIYQMKHGEQERSWDIYSMFQKY